MEKLESECETRVLLTMEEAKNVCKFGQGSECCAYLGASGSGMECLRMTMACIRIMDRLNADTMNAKGRGGWPGCAWEGHGG